MSIVVDIDDTLIETKHRLHGVWKLVLDSEVPMEDIETLSHGDVFMKHASDNQKQRMSEFQQRFWDLLLCEEEMGYELARLDRPIAHAAEVLRAWSLHSKIVYLTGRLEGTREFTLSQLEEFEFPIESTDLVMYHSSDFSRTRGLGTGPTLVEARTRLFGEITKKHRVTRVVDDYPGYFSIYKIQNVPDRIGLCISKKYTAKRFVDEGATRVVHRWEELLD
jgi:hypothetical protein